ncbi:MAG: FGGY-family carbohydrate kinase [Spirochaetaceae bacterium]|jgi:sugar (pentulose or hexulose) kinase|nr:FGGY-family carbohydrate kinase [Spirochaetaceae bacterium]
MDKLILSFDLGTQSARALLVSPKGDILFKAKKTFAEPYFSKAPGWAEQSADFYWKQFCEASLELKQMAGEAWDNIAAVTSSTIRDTIVCLDKENNVLGDVIIWLDTRKAVCPPLPAGQQALFTIAGAMNTVQTQRASSHVNWLAYQDKERWDKTAKISYISGWLNYKFSGVLVESTAGMIGHLPFDSKSRSWMKAGDILRAVFALDTGRQVALVPPGSEIGSITSEAAAATGIKAGIPYIVAGSDKGCETLGLSCHDRASAAISFGTTATVQFSTEQYFEPQPHLPAYPAIMPGFYNPEMEIYRGYWLLSWFKKEFAAKEVLEAEQKGVSAEHILDARLKEVPAGCDGLIMQPFFTPGASMPFAKGAVLGFSDVHTRIHLYRAIIEGINFALMEGLYQMEKRGKQKIEKLYVAGGGSQSDEVCRITANMFGLPVYRGSTFEATGLGAAIAAFVSLKDFASYEEAIKAMVHIKDEFTPNAKESRIYQELYAEVFEKIFSKLSPLYEVIDRVLLLN